jgi:hypothetical protein
MTQHGKVNSRHLGGIYPSKKYVFKNQPITTALRYKVNAINFRPETLNQQTVLQNLDSNISDILTLVGFDLMNRKSAKIVLQHLISMAQSYTSLTLQNEYNIILTRYNLDPVKAKNMFNAVIQMLINEGLITGFSFP